VELQAQLPDVDPHGTVLKGVIAGRLMEKSVANIVLCQVVGVTMDSPLGEVFEQLSEACALLER
jgi:hypothetical protein